MENAHFHVRLTPRESDALRGIAVRNGLSINHAIRHAIALLDLADRAKSQGQVIGAASDPSVLAREFVTVI